MTTSVTSGAASSPFMGQTAVVTGAGSGIGQAIACALAAGGARVAAVGRDARTLAATVELAVGAGEVLPLAADLRQPESIQGICRVVDETLGRLDLLVHSAAVMRLARLEAAAMPDFDDQYATNLRAPYALTQAMLPWLRASRGQVVFINSSVGLGANRPEVAQYSAIKHGLKAVADAIRQDVNPDGIRVLSVYPGRTATPMQRALHESEGKPYHPALLLQPSDVAAMVLSALTLPRTAEVTDISIRPMIKT